MNTVKRVCSNRGNAREPNFLIEYFQFAFTCSLVPVGMLCVLGVRLVAT
jgi:hypothetical protein